MFDQSQLYAALEKADAAGNTEDAKAIAQIIQQMGGQQKQTDSALGYSVDQAQRLYGQAARSIGSMFDYQALTDYGNEVIAQQDKDIAEGGYVSPLGNMSFGEAIGQGKGMEWIATRGAENAVTIGATPVIAGGTALAAWLGAPAVAVAGLGATTTVTGVGLGIGSVTDTAEQKGLDVEDQSTATKNVALGIVIGALDKIGASKLIPKSKITSMTNGEIAETLAKKDPGLAKRFIKEVWKGAKTEGVTEGAQTGVEVAGVAAQGGEFTADEIVNDVVDNFVLGASVGGTVSGTAKAGQEAVGAITGNPKTTENNAAAADFARDLEQVTADDGFNLQDVDPTSTEGARAAIDAVHQNYTGQMQGLIQALKDQLKIKDTDPEAQRLDKIQAKIAYNKARTKTKNTVGKQDFQAVEKLVGNTKEGQQLLALMRKSNELTRVHNNGLKGGVSRLTDALNPFDTNTGYSNQRTLAAPLIGAASAGAAYGTGGASIGPQLAAVLGGRGIDAMTGRRSRVAKFVKDYSKQQGMGAAKGPSVIQAKIDQQRQAELAKIKEEQAKAQQSEAMKAYNRQLGQQGSAPTPGSPQAVMEQATGLDKNGVAKVIKIIERIEQDGNANPAILKAINEYRISIDQGGTIDDKMLSPLIRAVNGIIDRTPQLQDLRVAEPDRGQAPEQSQSDEKVERGKKNNLAFLSDLKKQVNSDDTISLSDKAKLQEALAELGSPLGPQPVQSAMDIIEETEKSLRNKNLADKYLTPYLKRVQRQQGITAKKAEQGDDNQPALAEISNEPMFKPVDESTHDLGTTFYHGTASSFKQFDADKLGSATKSQSAKKAFWFVDDIATAEGYANHSANDVRVQELIDKSDEAEIMGDLDLSIKIMKEAEALEQQFANEPEAGQNIIPVILPKNLKVVDMEGAKYDATDMNLSDILDKAKQEGFAGVKLTNFSDTIDYSAYRPATHVAIFNPEDIRSQFAPRNIKEAKALYSLAATLGLVGLMAAIQSFIEDEEDRMVMA